MASYEKIDYRLRPAKGVERKMLCELMRGLNAFGPIRDYTYIGFGSVYFTDFSLVHRALGIERMHSIEGDEDAQTNSILKNRFEFNKPFACIDIHYGPATERLPEMDWSPPAIVWLDYDKPLLEEHLTDIGIVAQNAQPGSLVLITVNVQPVTPPQGKGDVSEKEFRYLELRKRLGVDTLPGDTEGKLLSTNELVRVYHQILTGVMVKSLDERNGNGDNPITPRQLINLRYKDNAEMVTFGWLLTDENQQEAYRASRLEALEFVRTGADSFKLEVPPLTPKEIAWLDAALHRHLNHDGTVKLPDNNKKQGPEDLRLAPALKGSMVNQYVKIYRYFPTFAEAIL